MLKAIKTIIVSYPDLYVLFSVLEQEIICAAKKQTTTLIIRNSACNNAKSKYNSSRNSGF